MTLAQGELADMDGMGHEKEFHPPATHWPLLFALCHLKLHFAAFTAPRPSR
jgi:hypothetical protein